MKEKDKQERSFFDKQNKVNSQEEKSFSNDDDKKALLQKQKIEKFISCLSERERWRFV